MIRILAVTLGTLFTIGMLILTVNVWGSGQKFSAYEHPFFPKNGKLQVIGCASLSSCEEVVKSQPSESTALIVPVHTSNDGVIFVTSDEDSKNFIITLRKRQFDNPQEKILLGANIYDFPFATIQKEIPSAIELQKLTEQLEAKWILNILDNVSEVHVRVADLFKDSSWDGKLLATSPILVVMTALKELKPGWLYGTSQPDIMRFLVFESLWILPAVTFKGDVFIAPFRFQKRPAFTEKTLEEARRRFKKILLGPLENPQELTEAQRLNPDGFIYRNLSEFQSFNQAK